MKMFYRIWAEINIRRALFIFSYISSKKNASLVFESRNFSPWFLLPLKSIFNKTTTILFFLKPSIKSLNQLQSITLASSSIKKKERTTVENFIFDFSLLQPSNKTKPSLFFFLWWELHSHISSITKQPLCE